LPVLVFSLVTMLGALKMRRLESHGLALLGSVLAMLPCSVGFVVGCPAGVWALFVLNRPKVRAAFVRRARPDGEPLPEEPSSMTRAAVRTPPPSTGQATASWPGAPPFDTWREPDLAAARDQVRAPAAGLFVTGVVALLLPLLVLAAMLVALVRFLS
jgi:hypothetical protein